MPLVPDETAGVSSETERAEPQLVRYVQYTPPSESASENRDTSPDLDDMNAGARSKRRSVPTVSKRDNVGKTKKRPRVALACQRCKSRKQRCDGAQPHCTNCGKSGWQCEYIIPTKTYPYGKTEYTRALEDRIAFLEARVSEECLAELGNDHYEPPSRRSSLMVSTSTQTDPTDREPIKDREADPPVRDQFRMESNSGAISISEEGFISQYDYEDFDAASSSSQSSSEPPADPTDWLFSTSAPPTPMGGIFPRHEVTRHEGFSTPDNSVGMNILRSMSATSLTSLHQGAGLSLGPGIQGLQYSSSLHNARIGSEGVDMAFWSN